MSLETAWKSIPALRFHLKQKKFSRAEYYFHPKIYLAIIYRKKTTWLLVINLKRNEKREERMNP